MSISKNSTLPIIEYAIFHLHRKLLIWLMVVWVDLAREYAELFEYFLQPHVSHIKYSNKNCATAPLANASP